MRHSLASFNSIIVGLYLSLNPAAEASNDGLQEYCSLTHTLILRLQCSPDERTRTLRWSVTRHQVDDFANGDISSNGWSSLAARLYNLISEAEWQTFIRKSGIIVLVVVLGGRICRRR